MASVIYEVRMVSPVTTSMRAVKLTLIRIASSIGVIDIVDNVLASGVAFLCSKDAVLCHIGGRTRS